MDDLAPNGVNMFKHSLSQAAVNDIIFYGCFLEPRPSDLFVLDNNVPSTQMHFPFSFSGTPYETTLSPINKTLVLAKKSGVLHEMVGNTLKRVLCHSDSPSYV